MAPENISRRPAQYKQSSRKGKKAWRKNIDLTDIEVSLAEKKEQEITHGTSNISDLKDAALFEVDETGDAALKSKLIKRKQIKKNLKSKEILDAIKTNSKVGAIKHFKHDETPKDKIQTVSKKEVRKLLALAGKLDGESKTKHRMAKDGLTKFKKVDLWDDTDSGNIVTPAGIKLKAIKGVKVPEDVLKKSTSGYSIASVRPATLSAEPVKIKDIEDIPHAGKSYNPDKSEWSKLIDDEFNREKALEDNKVAVREYKEKIRRLMEVLDDSEEEDSSSEEEELNHADDTVGDDNGENEDLVKLSVNDIVKNKKKTKSQRNKAKRHEEKVKLHQHLKDLKSKLQELEKLEEIEKDLALKEQRKQAQTQKEGQNKKVKLNSKHNVLEDNLEAKLSDELSDSLRKLRPEGSLLRDQIRKLQSAGKIESRVKMRKSKRNKPKITEKWTYKDFK